MHFSKKSRDRFFKATLATTLVASTIGSVTPTVLAAESEGKSNQSEKVAQYQHPAKQSVDKKENGKGNGKGKDKDKGKGKKDFELTIMHTNDSHAHLDNVPKLVTAVETVRAENKNTLLLNAGDVFSGTLFFNEFQGQADLTFLNLMGYDAMTFGNHEFDLGSSPEGHQALVDFIEGAKFPFVSANVDFSQDNKFDGLFSDLVSSKPKDGKIYQGIVKKIKGEKVGIFGLTTEETAAISSPGSIAFENYIKEAEKAVKAFEKMGVDKIVALTHIGYDDNAEIDNDLVLASAVEGIDVIVGGHSHTQLDEPTLVVEDLDGEEKEPTVIVQAYQYSEFLGQLNLTFDKQGVITEYGGQLLEVNSFEEDPEAKELLAPYSDRIAEITNEEIGVTLNEPLTNPRITDSGNTEGVSVRNSETILGNLITNGMLEKAKQYNENVVLAFQNGGGIRSAIDAGPVTVGEVITVLPFGNTLATMTVTGAELKAAFEISFKEYPAENGGFLHVAGGKVEFDSTKPVGERVVAIYYKDAEGNFVEIQDDETYTVATNAFTAKGGDGYDVFATAYAEGRVTDLGLSDWENFRDYLVSVESIPTSTEGRIVDVSKEVSRGDLMISQYIEGSSYNKAIELYNASSSVIDLSEYTLEIYTNGAPESVKSMELHGTLEAGEAIVLYHGQATDEIKSVGQIENSTVINFNGNDPLVLKKNDEIVDSIGQIGSSSDFAKDVTLVRNADVTTGDAIPTDAFTFETEWTNLGKDSFENLGQHPYIVEEPGEGETITIAQAREQGTGEVQVQGIVTGKLKNTIHIQDETAAIAVYGLADSVEVGDEVVLSGELADYRGLLQLQSPSLVERVSTGNEFSPIDITGAGINEENESKLATVQQVTVTANNGSGNYAANDSEGNNFVVRDENGSLGLEVGKTYDSLTGIIQQYNSTYQIIPRGLADVIEDATKVQGIKPSISSTLIPVGTAIELSTITEGATIHYTLDGSEPTKDSAVYSEPIVINEPTTIKAIAIKEGLTDSDIFSISYEVYDESPTISQIQGADHTSSFDGSVVDGVQGVITSLFELDGSQYFYMQSAKGTEDNDSSTSEGIVVYAGNASSSYSFKVGDLVSVTGTVDEYRLDGYDDADTDLTVTEINARNGSITVVESNVELPDPVVITPSMIPSESIDDDELTSFDPTSDAIDFWESLEGMRVQIGEGTESSLRVVSPEEYGEIITVFDSIEATTTNGGLLLGETDTNPERIQLKLFNGEKEVTNGGDINTGDQVNGPITGIVNYGYSNYKVYVDNTDVQSKIVDGGKAPDTTAITASDEKLTIASYNLENFSAQSDSEKVKKIAVAIADKLNSPDIVGVTEMQDNDGQTDSGSSAADQSYQTLINAIAAEGGPQYEYVNIDPEYNQDGGAPGGNIRVGFLYNPERVSLTEAQAVGNATTGTEYVNGALTLNPGRIDPTNDAFSNSRKPLAAQFTFNDEQVIVIANHWNSKSGDSPLFGSIQPPVLGSEQQRIQIASIIRNFVESIQSQNPEANIVALGDFNDFQWTPALQTLEGDNESMVNMIYSLDEADRYTYTYQGNSQALDHIFVSSNLVEKSVLDILHVNSDFTEESGRASDHDPVLTQIDFK